MTHLRAFEIMPAVYIAATHVEIDGAVFGVDVELALGLRQLGRARMPRW